MTAIKVCLIYEPVYIIPYIFGTAFAKLKNFGLKNFELVLKSEN